jgi:hypothetical protein
MNVALTGKAEISFKKYFYSNSSIFGKLDGIYVLTLP